MSPAGVQRQQKRYLVVAIGDVQVELVLAVEYRVTYVDQFAARVHCSVDLTGTSDIIVIIIIIIIEGKYVGLFYAF